MEITAESLVILLVLVPGFVSSVVLDLVMVRQSHESWAKLIEALMFSFLIYVVVGGILQLSPFAAGEPKVTPNVEQLRALINPWFLIATLATAVFLPLVMGFVAQRNWHMKVLQRMGITERTGRSSVWLDVFAEQKYYVICNLTGGRRIFGWPLYNAESAEGPLLYLHDPSWIEADGSYTSLGVAGILLMEKDGIESIEFMKAPSATSSELEDQVG